MQISAEHHTIGRIENKRNRKTDGMLKYIYRSIKASYSNDLYDNHFCSNAQLFLLKTIFCLEDYLHNMKESHPDYKVKRVEIGLCEDSIRFETNRKGMIILANTKPDNCRDRNRIDLFTIRGEIGSPFAKVYHHDYKRYSPAFTIKKREDLFAMTEVKHTNSILLSKITNLIAQINLQYALSEGRIYQENEYYQVELLKKEKEYAELNEYTLKEISFTTNEVTLSRVQAIHSSNNEVGQLIMIKEKNKFDYENTIKLGKQISDIVETVEFKNFMDHSEQFMKIVQNDGEQLFKFAPYFKHYIPTLSKSFKALKGIEDTKSSPYLELSNKTVETLSVISEWIEEQLSTIHDTKKDIIVSELDEIVMSIKHKKNLTVN